MQATDFVYAVARIRTAEMRLLTQSDIEQLLGAPDEKTALRLLADKGWEKEEGQTTEQLLQTQLQKAWALLQEALPRERKDALHLLLVPNDYQNLKAAIETTLQTLPLQEYIVLPTTLDLDKIQNAIRERNTDTLPESMRAPAAEALQVLLHEDDGQRCEILLDIACLRDLYKGAQTSEGILKSWAETRVRFAVLLTAWRCARLQRSLAFCRFAIPSGCGLDSEALSLAAVQGEEAFLKLVEDMGMREEADAMRTSVAAFEKLADDRVMALIAGEKHNPFGPGPLAAYYLGRENEVRVVRILLAGKRSGLPEQAIRERLRDMYG